MDPLRQKAPAEVAVVTYRAFRGDQPYENGGDPNNDFQRYEIMASHQIDRNSVVPGDYRSLMSTGPFVRLLPGESIELHIGFVAGEGLGGMLDNAARVQRLFNGTWYDLDRDRMTGIDGRETPVRGPAQDVVVDGCRPELADSIDVPPGTLVWVNSDCAEEELFLEFCGYEASDSLDFRTGVAGKETQVHWTLGRILEIQAAMDIRPGSCPNPFNMNRADFAAGDNPKKGGVLPVAILGNGSFNVRDIDIASVRLEGVATLDKKPHYKDVSRPVANPSSCACTSEGPDGNLDLALKFSNQEIARALDEGGAPVRGEKRALILTGTLRGGTPFSAEDCVVFVGKPDDKPDGKPGDGGRKPELRAAAPNPFNPATCVQYYLPERQRVCISVFDASGRMVAVLVDGVQAAGEHSVQWKASGCASGIYFCRLEAGDCTSTKKIVLIR
jgi:hypothetical protein